MIVVRSNTWTKYIWHGIFTTCVSEFIRYLTLDTFTPFSNIQCKVNKNIRGLFKFKAMISMWVKLFYAGKIPIPTYFGKDYPNFGVLFIVHMFVFEARPNK